VISLCRNTLGEFMFHRHSHRSHDRHFARGEHRHDDHEHGHGRHGRGGGRSGLGRFFAHGDLRLGILHLIAEKPRHGYEITKARGEPGGGPSTPSPGVISPPLTMPEDLGPVTVTAGDSGKKLHAIPAEGRAYLDAYRPAVEALLARMDEAGRMHG